MFATVAIETMFLPTHAEKFLTSRDAPTDETLITAGRVTLSSV
jgi:hypothetical protein